MRGAACEGLGGQGVRLPVQLLHQEIEAPPAGAALVQRAPDLGDVGFEPIEFLVDIGFLGQVYQFLLQAVLVDLDVEIRNSRKYPFALPQHQLWQAQT